MTAHFTVDGVEFTTLSDNQVISAEPKHKLQEAVYKFHQTVQKYNLNISSKKIKAMTFAGAESEQRLSWLGR